MERERAGGVAAREGRGRPEREQGVRGGSRPGGARASGSEAEGEERKEGGREKKKEKEKRERKENGKKEKEIEEKKMGGREKKKKEGGKGGARQRRPRLRSATRGVRPREVGHAVGGERGKRRGEKGGAGFAAAGHDASRWMGRVLNSGVGLFRRGSGDLGSGFEGSRAQRKTTLAHDLLSEFSGCYKPTPLKMNLVLEIRLVPKQVGKLLL